MIESMLPEAKIDYDAPEKYGEVVVRGCTEEEAQQVASEAVGEHLVSDEGVMRYGISHRISHDVEGEYKFSFFVYRKTTS